MFHTEMATIGRNAVRPVTLVIPWRGFRCFTLEIEGEEVFAVTFDL